MQEQALEKIDKELKAFQGNQYGQIIKNGVADALKSFAAQDEEFAQAIVHNEKTLSHCCTEIMKGVGGGISDIETYRRAVQFYFPGADVKFHMTVDLCPAAGESATDKPAGKVLDLADFF